MRIICATDFSPAARAAGNIAAQLAAKLGDTVLLVHAIDPVSMVGLEVTAAAVSWETALREAAERELDIEAARLRATGVTVRTRVLAGRPAEITRKLAAEDESRMVVVGSHGRKGAAHLFLEASPRRLLVRRPAPFLSRGACPTRQKVWREDAACSSW